MKKVTCLLFLLVFVIGEISTAQNSQTTIQRAENRAEQGYSYNPVYVTESLFDSQVRSSQNNTITDVLTVLNDEERALLIKIIQVSLNSLGFDAGPVDGIYGPKTQEAVRSFNNKNYISSNRINVSTLDRTAAAVRNSTSSSTYLRNSGYSFTSYDLSGWLVDYKGRIVPRVAENGSYYGQTSTYTGRPKTVYVKGYYRKNGTYVRGHYRSRPNQ